MPNPWTGVGNPYTRKEMLERLQDTLSRGEAIIGAGAGTGISAKFIEKGGADLIIIYNSGRFRMAGAGSTAGLMSYGDANAIAMEIGEFEVLPVVEEIPVIWESTPPTPAAECGTSCVRSSIWAFPA
jgi:predicted TIM-barrel enzyme